MSKPEEKDFPEIPYAVEIDEEALKEVGGPGMLEKIFTKEKIEACQGMIDKAKANFFETSQPDMDRINALAANDRLRQDYRTFCRQIFRPVSNIRGQAKVFGFQLVDRICGYIQEYCENASSKQMSPKDVFIIGKLVEALQKAFEQKIVDQGGDLEKELIETIEKVSKIS